MGVEEHWAGPGLPVEGVPAHRRGRTRGQRRGFDQVLRWWWGVGPGNFARVSEATRQALGIADPSGQQYIHAHNIWWNPFVASGIFAGLTHALLMIYILGLTLVRLEGERTRALALNLLMIWLVYQFYGLVELAPTMEEIIPYVWGGTGLLAGTIAASDRS